MVLPRATVSPLVRTREGCGANSTRQDGSDPGVSRRCPTHRRGCRGMTSASVGRASHSPSSRPRARHDRARRGRRADVPQLRCADPRARISGVMGPLWRAAPSATATRAPSGAGEPSPGFGETTPTSTETTTAPPAVIDGILSSWSRTPVRAQVSRDQVGRSIAESTHNSTSTQPPASGAVTAMRPS